ncbi:aminotransferase class I/II-fold pyridoxal phosphate-dependent enzyme, partial [Bifidobacterium animalis]|uniref:aminotransferase class I/II-fold pyridoxal phosphate-dependent enzyme n=1 Tax=Bifidobacterium animalis TaxID=28025 RepID=UPI001D0219F3
EPNLDDIEAARTDRTKAIIVTSPNNPTGAVWSERTIRDIAEWALDHYVGEDTHDIYGDLPYDDVKTTH